MFFSCVWWNSPFGDKNVKMKNDMSINRNWMNVLALICYILHMLLWRSRVYIQAQLQASSMVKWEGTQERWIQQPHMASSPLRLPSCAPFFHGKGVSCLSVSGLCVDRPRLAVFHISALLGPAAHFCLISLTLLLSPCHHACLFSLRDFYTCLPVAARRSDSGISRGLGSPPAWKTHWVDVSQSLSLTLRCPRFAGLSRFPTSVVYDIVKTSAWSRAFPRVRPSSPFKARSLSISFQTETMQIISVLPSCRALWNKTAPAPCSFYCS